MSPVFVTTPFLVQKALKTANSEKCVFSCQTSKVVPEPPSSLVFCRKPAPGVCSAPEIMEHFDPLMWVIENPATGLLKPPVHGAPTLGGRHLLQVRDSVQEADPTVDQHALRYAGAAAGATRGRRHLRGAQGGPRLMGGQRERVRGQSRELLYRISTALCEEIARGHGRACGSAEHPGLKRGAFLISFFFPSRHALRRRPISRPTWHTATARRLRLRTLGRTCS